MLCALVVLLVPASLTPHNASAAPMPVRTYSPPDPLESSGDRIFTWPIELQPGANVVTAESLINGKRHTDTVTWVLSY